MNPDLKKLENELLYLYQQGVPLGSKYFKIKVYEFKKLLWKHFEPFEFLSVKSYIFDTKTFFFNSKKCSQFLNYLYEEGFVIMASYYEINKEIGKRLNKTLNRYETYIGWMEGQNILKVLEFGKTSGKKCLIYLQPKIIKNGKH